MDTFGVSTLQASLDLNANIEQAKRKIVYDNSLRIYLRGKHFKLDEEEYFSQLRAVGQELESAVQSWISFYPNFGTTLMPACSVVPDTIRDVLATILESTALLVNYQSMSRSEPSARWIEPHALTFDRFCGHIRAFCQNVHVFKDFLLSRFMEVGEQGPSTADASAGEAWHRKVILEIDPHPDLSDTQRSAIELDYGVDAGRAQISIRRVLLFYAFKRLGLDTDATARRPHDQQIVILNRDEIVG